MYNYMYQYRGEVERIVTNLDRDKAWQYVRSLYHSGLVSLPEWNILSEYSKEYRKTYPKFIKK